MVLVVASSENASGNELRGAIEAGWALGRGRCVVAQALMRSGHVVVLPDELPQQSLQMSLV